MNIIAVPYGTDHQNTVRLNDTLRILVSVPKDGNTWAGNVTIRTSYGASATDDVALAKYSGGNLRGQKWDLFVDYDTSSIPLVANTKYLITAEVTSGSKKAEYVTNVTVLPQGR